MNPLWKPLACGCHLNRDTQAVFKNAGFHYDTLEATNHPRLFPLFSSVMIGSAHKETALPEQKHSRIDAAHGSVSRPSCFGVVFKFLASSG